MSAQSVRTTIQAFLQAANIPGLTTINRSMTMESGSAYAIPDSGNAGACAYVWLITNKETVISMGGAPSVQPNGWRYVSYNAALIFDYFVLAASTTDDTWTDDLDVMVEAIKTALRSDPTLGTTGEGALTIFSAANEMPLEDPSITILLEAPTVADEQTWLVHGSIDFPIHETIQPG